MTPGGIAFLAERLRLNFNNRGATPPVELW
jgi:hypothetical protein